MEVRILWIGRYFTLAGPAKPIRVARPKAVDLASIKNSRLWSNTVTGYIYLFTLNPSYHIQCPVFLT